MRSCLFLLSERNEAPRTDSLGAGRFYLHDGPTALAQYEYLNVSCMR